MVPISAKNSWLDGTTLPPGIVTDNTDAFRFIRHFQLDTHIRDLPCFRKQHFAKLKYAETLEFLEMWYDFEAFISHTWWTRVWTAQEAILPQRVTFYWGACTITLSDVFAARDIMERHHSVGCCLTAFFILPNKKRDTIGDMIFHLDLIQSHSCSKLIIPQDFALIEIDDILQSFSNRKCTDPRDKVYGLLGLVKNLDASGINPDYSLTPDEVCVKIMREIIEGSHGRLTALTGRGFSSKAHDMGLLPSWTRDFTASRSISSDGTESTRCWVRSCYRACDACGHAISSISRIEGRVLRVQGVFVGKLRTISSNGVSNPSGHLGTLRRWSQELRDHQDVIRPNAGQLGSVRKPESRKDRNSNKGSNRSSKVPEVARTRAFWRAAVADSILNSRSFDSNDSFISKMIPKQFLNKGHENAKTESFWHRPSERDLERFCELGQNHLFSKLSLRTLGGSLRHLMYSLGSALRDRCMFLSEPGNPGLCYPEARIGDEIWVLFGSNVPFLLRQVENASDGAPVHRFVGECFYYGVMFGEALVGDYIVCDITLQ